MQYRRTESRPHSRWGGGVFLSLQRERHTLSLCKERKTHSFVAYRIRGDARELHLLKQPHHLPTPAVSRTVAFYGHAAVSRTRHTVPPPPSYRYPYRGPY